MEEGVLALDDEGRIINMNPAAGRLLDVQPAVARGRLAHEVVRKAPLLAFLDRALADPAPIGEDMNLLGASDIALRSHSAPLVDADRGRIGLLVVLRDVTREQRLENVQREFVANVSHELRTPTTSIKGFAETLLDGALDDPETARRFVETILLQADRLSAVISDIISLSRIERDAEEHRVELVPGPVSGVLESAVEVCRRAAAEKQIALELQCGDDAVAPISAGLLEQAVVNLLDNAIKYTDPGKTVLIEARREEDTVVIRVRDEGWGIESRHLPRLFDRFYRVDKGRSRSLGGTGLGLAIVKHIALVHGGSVGVESSLGRGSTFTVTLPAAEPTETP
jgi:two-component system phosphate regulon sensor histidine kinase PhoR